ncbi:MAG TPA: VanZ family protein [Flavisolibacter sp.]|nr:VanZ family protein [Flavisolibacter sp.]
MSNHLNREDQIRRSLNIVFFILYLFFLFYIILFKGPAVYKVVAPFEYAVKSPGRTIYTDYNVVPFRTIQGYFAGKTWTSSESKIANVFGNIALFMPFGFLFPLVFKKKERFWSVVLASFLLSCLLEAFQLVFHTGFCDVDDVLLNTTGGLLGYLFYAVIYR